MSDICHRFLEGDRAMNSLEQFLYQLRYRSGIAILWRSAPLFADGSLPAWLIPFSVSRYNGVKVSLYTK